MKKKSVLTWMLVLFMILFCVTACAQKSQVPEQPETDISQEKAQDAAEGIREYAQLTLNAAETVYVYAYPTMLKEYGDKIESMDAETYFLQYARMIQADDMLKPQDEAVKEAMDEIGLDIENGSFNMESLSAGMSTKVSAVPSAMQEAIKNYDSASQDENGYLQAAYEAYQNFRD